MSNVFVDEKWPCPLINFSNKPVFHYHSQGPDGVDKARVECWIYKIPMSPCYWPSLTSKKQSRTSLSDRSVLCVDGCRAMGGMVTYCKQRE